MGAAGAMAMGAYTMFSGVSDAAAKSEQAHHELTMAEQNARFSELQEADAKDRGVRDAARVRGRVRQVRGSQRAALAAQGIDINSGSARDVQTDTETLGALDELTVRNNAWREAWGYKTQALNYRMEGQMAYKAGQSAANKSLLTGGLKALTTFGSGGG
jgi:hypothetical protein